LPTEPNGHLRAMCAIADAIASTGFATAYSGGAVAHVSSSYLRGTRPRRRFRPPPARVTASLLRDICECVRCHDGGGLSVCAGEADLERRERLELYRCVHGVQWWPRDLPRGAPRFLQDLGGLGAADVSGP